jgi:GDP-L-fucose synthase
VHVMGLPKDSYLSVTEPMLSHINVGTGVDVTIRELAETIGEVVGFHGELKFDTSKPDGTPRKLMDISTLAKLGWQPEYDLKKGLAQAYAWFVENRQQFRH